MRSLEEHVVARQAIGPFCEYSRIAQISMRKKISSSIVTCASANHKDDSSVFKKIKDDIKEIKDHIKEIKDDIGKLRVEQMKQSTELEIVGGRVNLWSILMVIVPSLITIAARGKNSFIADFFRK